MPEIEPLDDFERNILSIPHLTDAMRGEIFKTHRQGLAEFEKKQAKRRVEIGAGIQARAEETSRNNTELLQKADQIIDDAVQRAGHDITAALGKVEVKRKK